MKSEGGLLMFDSLFNEVLDIVRDWAPKKGYPSEAGYRDDLANYLRNELKRGTPFDLAPRRHKVKKEHGRSLADIAIDEKIGIELKKDLKNRPAIDRLSGQVRRFKKNYSDVVIVLCGSINEEAYDEVMELETTASPFGQQCNVAIVRKDRKKKKPSSWEDELVGRGMS